MAGIDTGGGHGRGRAVNQEIPLVPFIDFLLCCVMFLLVTAVWNQLARVEGAVAIPGEQATPEPDVPEVRRLRIHAEGYELSYGGGVPERFARSGEHYDLASLGRRLGDLAAADPSRKDLVVEADDGVRYADVIDALDVSSGAGLVEVSVSPDGR